MRKIVEKAYELLILVASKFQSPLLLLLRLYWGWQFFQTGKGKLMNIDKTAEFFASLNIPLPKLNVIMAGSTECFGGLLLLVGLGSRLVSLPLMFTMIVAYLTADLDKVKNIFGDPDKFVTADPFLFLLVAVIVMTFGPGVFSVDYVIKKKLACQASGHCAAK
jgi:putative oxidoreductase